MKEEDVCEWLLLNYRDHDLMARLQNIVYLAQQAQRAEIAQSKAIEACNEARRTLNAFVKKE